MQRRFGPVRGAGTVVIERPPEQGITPSSLGVVALIGQFERGTISTAAAPKLNACPGPRSFAKKCGGRLAGLVAPDVAQDFFEHGQGAGELYAVRVTDGNELLPSLKLYSRDWGTDYIAPESEKGNVPQQKRAVLLIKAKNAGAWGGRRRVIAGVIANVAADLAETTLDTKLTGLKANEFAGATLTLSGVAHRTYKVLSHTTAGVFTVEADSKMKTDLGASADHKFSIALDVALTAGGSRKALGCRVKEAQIDPASNFGLEITLNGELVQNYSTLSMDPASEYYVEKVVNKDTGNDEFEVVDLWSGQGAVSPRIRPANFYGRLTSVAGLAITVEPFQVVQVPAGVVLQAVNFPAGADPVPHRLTLTWSAAANEYAVTAAELSTPSVYLRNLPAFAVGNGAQANKTYDPPNKYTLGLTVTHTAEPADGAQLIVDVLPVNSLVAPGGLVAPDASGKPLTRFRVKSATYNTLTIESGDLAAAGATGSTKASVTGNVAGPYNIGAGANAYSFKIDGLTVAGTLGANIAKALGDVVAEINAAWLVAGGTGAIASESGGFLKLDSPGGLNGGGPGSIVEIVAVANNAYATLGIAVGAEYGTAGTEVQAFYADEPWGGFDGGAPTDQAYIDALSIANTPLKQLAGKNKGVVQIACPGVTATAVQKQGIQLAEAMSYHFHVLFPETTVDEVSAVDYINDTIGRSDFACTFFPSWASVPDPDKPGLNKSIPVTGMVMGRDALFARNYQGYHRPAAGIDATLPRIVELPTGDTVLNEELLTPQGINVIKVRSGNFVIWGARTINKSTSFAFRPHRLQLSHYERTFLESFDWVIFMLNNAPTRRSLVGAFLVYFSDEFTKGAIVGSDVADAAQIKIDDDNNSAADAAAGNLNAEIKIRLVDVIERFVISIGKAGLFENTSAAA